jgi:hypothetical protein
VAQTNVDGTQVEGTRKERKEQEEIERGGTRTEEERWEQENDGPPLSPSHILLTISIDKHTTSIRLNNHQHRVQTPSTRQRMLAWLERVQLAPWKRRRDLSYTTCAFPTPDVQSWRAVAVAVSSSTLPIPPSSGYAVIVLGRTAVISVVAKYTVVPPKYHDFIP